MCWRYLATAQPALCCENCSCCTGNPVVPTLPCVLRASSFTLSAWTAEEGRASSGGKSGAPEETHIRNKPGSGALWPLLPSALLLCSHSSCSSSCPALLSSHRCPNPHLHLSSTYWVLSTLWCTNTFAVSTSRLWILLFICYLFFANFSAVLRCPNTSSIFPELWEHMLNLYSAWLKITVFVHKAKEIMCFILLLPIQG